MNLMNAIRFLAIALPRSTYPLVAYRMRCGSRSTQGIASCWSGKAGSQSLSPEETLMRYKPRFSSNSALSISPLAKRSSKNIKSDATAARAAAPGTTAMEMVTVAIKRVAPCRPAH